MEVILDCSQLTDKKNAHTYLKEQFGFPDYYGNNLDALYDCLTELGDCQITLQNPAALYEGNSYGAAVLYTLKDAARSNPHLALLSSPLDEATHPYEAEVRARWGSTAAYQEFAKKAKGNSTQTNQAMGEGMEQIFAAFAHCMQGGAQPNSTQAQAHVAQLQEYITEHFYPCTKEILAGLGQMYVVDSRFTENLDRHAVGTAAYVSQAIRLYCE